MLTLCHTCDVVLAHPGAGSLETATDHALDEHADLLAADPGSLRFSDVTIDPTPLLWAPPELPTAAPPKELTEGNGP